MANRHSEFLDDNSMIAGKAIFNTILSRQWFDPRTIKAAIRRFVRF